ncbi:MAG: pyruvate ferredoxin oxidoreductase [Chloroflexi bacterium]|nr:pyruvate ferredoxin oxidoreductase [Chloroflexota bacterium]
MRQLLEGSQAIAQAVAACRPQVVSAYPITPQTHIVEDLVELAASGKLSVECLNVESEFAAASVVLGATAAGSRAYTATSSQGLLLMTEVLYNIAGLRLPIVLTGANRAISAPLNIWNDHQDVMAVRDSGWIQLFAADNQEAADLHPQAYRLAEQLRVPVMVNVDGFILTHALEPVEVPDQALVDQFLPPLSLRLLEPAAPRSIGMMVEPDKYAEVRYAQHQVLLTALKVIPPLGEQFRELFGRPGLQLVQPYRMAGSEPAATAVVCLGSVSGTVQEAIDRLRADGWPVGSVAIQTYRPFPAAALRQTLGACGKIVVLEKAVAPGTPTGAIVAAEIAAAMYGRGLAPLIRPYILGLGGRDVTVDDICRIVAETHQTPAAELTSSDDGSALDGQFYRLNWELLGGEVAEQWQTR